MNDPIQQGTVGLRIRLVLLDAGAVYDPALASYLDITIIKPGGQVLLMTAPNVIVGETTDGRPCLEYDSQEGDLDQAGNYRVTGYVEDATGKWPAAPVTFRVHASRRAA